MTEKVFSKEWSDWIFENIERGCSLEDIYAILYKQGFNKSDIEWSSVVKLGLEEELLKLYHLSEREKHEKERDTKLTELILHKAKT